VAARGKTIQLPSGGRAKAQAFDSPVSSRTERTVPRPCCHAVLNFHAANSPYPSRGLTCLERRNVRSWKADPAKKREYKTRLQAAAGPPRAGPGEAHGAGDRGGVHRRARAAAIAARSRAGRNPAIDRDHRRRRIQGAEAVVGPVITKRQCCYRISSRCLWFGKFVRKANGRAVCRRD